MMTLRFFSMFRRGHATCVRSVAPRFIAVLGTVIFSVAGWAGDAGADEVAKAKIRETLKAELAAVVPEGWARSGEVEQYLVQDLYVKINGRSELYMAYDVDSLTFETLINEDDKTQFIDVYIYDMSSPTGAFGVFSVERGTGHTTLELGRAGYIDGASVFFWKGQYYVCVVPTEANDAIAKATKSAAASLSKALDDSGGAVKGLAAVPTKDMVEGSVQFFMEDAMSLDFMSNLFTARYRKGDSLVTGFVSEKESGAVAREVVGKYVEYMKKYGEDIQRREVNGVELISADMGGVYDVIFHKGPFVSGVSSCFERDLAEETASDLASALR